VHGLLSGGSADSSAEREFPSDKVYRPDDRWIVGVESISLAGLCVRRDPYRLRRAALSCGSGLTAAEHIVGCVGIIAILAKSFQLAGAVVTAGSSCLASRSLRAKDAQVLLHGT
jgi:hypothetical protein